MCSAQAEGTRGRQRKTDKVASLMGRSVRPQARTRQAQDIGKGGNAKLEGERESANILIYSACLSYWCDVLEDDKHGWAYMLLLLPTNVRRLEGGKA